MQPTLFSALSTSAWLALVSLLATTPGTALADPAPAVRGRDAPDAWLAPSGTLRLSAGSDAIRARPVIHAGLGLGGAADIELGYRGDLEACRLCGDADDGDTEALSMLTARFRLGGDLEPLLSLPVSALVGFERTVVARDVSLGGDRHPPQYATLHLSLGATAGPVRASGGFAVWEGGDQDSTLPLPNAAAAVRPFGSLSWRPSTSSKTALVGEVAWEPHFTADQMQLRWVASAGVHYLAFPWGSSELLVRGAGGDDAFLMASVRFHARASLL